ncbi:MAG: ankyrin repeat domain-containing protein [bacterium]
MQSKKVWLIGLMVIFVVIMISCGKSPERAKSELLQMDLEFSPKGFIKAVSEGNKIAIDLFMITDMDPNTKNQAGYSALMIAAQGNNAAICKSLLQNKKTNSELKGPQNETALHLAAKKGQVDAIQTLLSFKVNPNSADKFGSTPLMYAAEYGQTKACEALLLKGANINQQNDWGNTALMYAAKEGKADTVKSLIANKADVTIWNTGKKTAMKFAKDRGASDIVKMLAIAGATE